MGRGDIIGQQRVQLKPDRGDGLFELGQVHDLLVRKQVDELLHHPLLARLSV